MEVGNPEREFGSHLQSFEQPCPGVTRIWRCTDPNQEVGFLTIQGSGGYPSIDWLEWDRIYPYEMTMSRKFPVNKDLHFLFLFACGTSVYGT